MRDKVMSRRLGLVSWMTDPEHEDVDTGTAPPKKPIKGGLPPVKGGWPINPVKKKKPKNFAR